MLSVFHHHLLALVPYFIICSTLFAWIRESWSFWSHLKRNWVLCNVVCTQNSTIKPGTHTARLLNVNQNEQAFGKVVQQVWVQLTQYLLWDFHIFLGLTQEIHLLFKKYVRIKIEQHKILVLMIEPLNSTINTGIRMTTYLPSECVWNIRKRGKYMFVSKAAYG